MLESRKVMNVTDGPKMISVDTNHMDDVSIIGILKTVTIKDVVEMVLGILTVGFFIAGCVLAFWA